MSSAVLFFILNLIGLGLGPLFIGMVSDFLNPTLGDESIRYAMVMTVPVLHCMEYCPLYVCSKIY